MKHLLNDLSQSEKNRILEQYNNSLTVDTSKFKKLLESKLGNVKPILTEDDDSIPFGNYTCVTNTIDIGSKLWPKKSEQHPGRYYMREFRDSSGRSQYTMTSGGMKIVYYDSGAYYIEKSDGTLQPSGKQDFYRYYCQGNTIKRTTEITRIDGPLKKVPFKDNTEGNKFRAWVNQNYPKIAKEIDLDKVGIYYDSYMNEYMKKAWNYKVDGKTLGDRYSNPSSPVTLPGMDWMSDMLKDKSTIQTDTKPLKQLCPILTNSSNIEGFDLRNKTQDQLKAYNVIINGYAIAYNNEGIPVRISCQAALNKIRPGFKDKNQIIIDSREHLIYVYDKNNKFIAKDAVITGADAQSKTAEVIARSFMDFNDKLEASGFKQTMSGIVDTTGKNRTYDFKYILAKNQEMGSRFLNPGVYTTSKSTTDDAHYAGKENNILSLSHLKQGDVLQAIHGFVTTDPNRVAAMNLAKNVLSDPTNPSVGKKFLDMVKLKQINLSQSYGCINVPERFVPYLERYMKDSYVFNISEDQNNYLVQNTENYFEKMKEPFCPSPSSLGAEIPAEFDQLSTMS